MAMEQPMSFRASEELVLAYKGATLIHHSLYRNSVDRTR